ncbi:MAG: ABC transporter ATP-binding protein [Anaerolineae bacterium]
MTIAVDVRDVSKVFGTGTSAVRAVDKISLTVNEGEFIGLAGPSGSGKTTLLAMLAALLKPTEGEIWIEGHDLGKMNEGQRTRFRRDNIGFTFQANNLVPFLNVQENVELMLRLTDQYNKGNRSRATEILQRLGLGERLTAMPSQLSGGQQQRVAIARALIHRPSVVLADEPTAALDTERAFQVVETFADLIHEEGRAGIMVTHDFRMMRFVDRMIHMQDGQIDRILSDRHEIDALAYADAMTVAPAVVTAGAQPAAA